MFRQLSQDLRHAARTIAKNPLFTAVAVLTLALGVGANTAMFAVVNSMLFRPLPYREPQKLEMLFLNSKMQGQEPASSPYWSYPKFEVLRKRSTVFEDVAAVGNQDFALTGTSDPERIQVDLVSTRYFPMLGVSAMLGRTFSSDEDIPSSNKTVALLSYGFWKRRYGSDETIAGKNISINQVPFTIIGVLPQSFHGRSEDTDVWVPIATAPALTFPRRLTAPFSHWHTVIARLKPQVSPAQAQAEMALISRRIEKEIPVPADMAAEMPPETVQIVPLQEATVDPVLRKSLLLLLSAVGFVLLIACANVANLLLTRGISRQKEIAIRMALGSSKRRIVAQLLTESLVLALLGGLAGLLLASWTTDSLAAVAPAADPSRIAIYSHMQDLRVFRWDGSVLVFTAGLIAVTTILFGIIPSLQASRLDVNHGLKNGAARWPFYGKGLTQRNFLVIAEIAMALVLLIGAGLMFKSFSLLKAVRLGFLPDQLLTMQIDLPKYTEERANAFYPEIVKRAALLPEVESACAASSVPFSGYSPAAGMTIFGRSSKVEKLPVRIHSISPEYFRTFQIPLLKGRFFTDQDRAGSKRVAILNEAAAKQFWPGKDPIGERIRLTLGWEKNEYAEVIAIAGDVKYSKVEDVAEPAVYLSYLQPSEPSSFLTLRTTADPASVLPAVRNMVLALDRNVPLYDVKTMEERAADIISRNRFLAVLLAVYAGIALSLAAVGIYGLMAFSVSSRTREIGVRIALGAQRKDVLRLVLKQGAVLSVCGVGIGLVASLGLTRLLSSLLYAVQPTDLATLAGVTTLLMAVAIGACYLPARRAASGDPLIALRYE